MNTVPLELNRQDLFTCPIYRGNDTSWLSLDTHVDPIIDNLKKENKEKLKNAKPQANAKIKNVDGSTFTDLTSSAYDVTSGSNAATQKVNETTGYFGTKVSEG